MSKKEYLDSLREFLSFELPERLVKKNIDYYDSYFDEQLRSGKSADEVCEELGDPQLIAKSCINAETAGADGIPDSGDEIDYSEEIEKEKHAKGFGFRSAETTGSKSFDQDGNNVDPQTKKTVSSGTGCLIFGLIVIGIIALLIAFFSTSLGSALLTVILGVLILKGILKLFRR